MFGSELVNFGVGTRAYEIAKCLMLPVGHPHRREIATAQQPRELERIPPIGLHLVAWPHRNQRGRDHHAFDIHLGELAMQRVAGWSSLRTQPATPRICHHPAAP